ACTLVAPLAFAQTSTTTTETTTEPATTTQTTSTTYTAGTVTTYEPGKTVVVKGDQGPVSFALGTAARVVDGAGRIVTAPLCAGHGAIAKSALQAFMTSEWMNSSMIVHSIPKGTTAAQLENDPRLLEGVSENRNHHGRNRLFGSCAHRAVLRRG